MPQMVEDQTRKRTSQEMALCLDKDPDRMINPAHKSICEPLLCLPLPTRSFPKTRSPQNPRLTDIKFSYLSGMVAQLFVKLNYRKVKKVVFPDLLN